MRAPQAAGWTRRRFLGGLTVAGTAGLLGLTPGPVAAEPPPETTTLRLALTTSICQAPQYVVEALFAAEGFTEVQFVGEAARADQVPRAGSRTSRSAQSGT
jgi:NitT/TauT family transport system substrate-binding protein